MNTLNPAKLIVLVAFALLISLGAAASAQENPIGPIDPATPPTPARSVPPVVQAWMDAWNTGDAQGMRALFTEDGVYQDFAFQAQVGGREGVAAWVELTVQNIPDTQVEIIEAFRTGDRITVKWVFSGTPERIGPIEGTGASFSVPAVSVFELEGDLITRLGDYYNRADVFAQLGYPDLLADSQD